jgi:hypothetical protein
MFSPGDSEWMNNQMFKLYAAEYISSVTDT